jgi:hypothetical protein
MLQAIGLQLVCWAVQSKAENNREHNAMWEVRLNVKTTAASNWPADAALIRTVQHGRML